MVDGPWPAGHHFLGPVLWAPPFVLPDWWAALPADRPVVYANLGSSGGLDGLSAALRALAPCRWTVVAATAGGRLETPLPPDAAAQVHLAAYLPGDHATARADLVICNGGSMTCQQALLAGRPVLGIAGNMDQFMNMSAVVAAGAGICLRADRLDAGRLRAACDALLGDPAYRSAARALGARLHPWDAGARLADLLPTLTAPR
jgi:UDP:flavonoid glycosyltransferase YjiC (YdhE family)